MKVFTYSVTSIRRFHKKRNFLCREQGGVEDRSVRNPTDWLLSEQVRRTAKDSDTSRIVIFTTFRTSRLVLMQVDDHSLSFSGSVLGSLPSESGTFFDSSFGPVPSSLIFFWSVSFNKTFLSVTQTPILNEAQ